MTALVLASILLTIPFLVAFIGIPLWMTFARPETGADHTRAQRYLAGSRRAQPARRPGRRRPGRARPGRGMTPGPPRRAGADGTVPP